VRPRPLPTALLIAAALLAFVAFDQSHWWRVKDDYGFGWLAPVFVAFVIRERWPAIVGCANAPASAAPVNWVARIGGGLLFLGGALLFLLGAFYRAGAGPSQPGTLAITLGAIGLIVPLLAANTPAGSRRRLLGLVTFPVLIWLISAPMVSVVESRVNLLLLRHVVNVVAATFTILGLPIEQHGNVLALPTGNVGVEEACSGIRSLTACLFAGSFLAAVFLDRAWKKVALVVAAALFAVFTNVLRSLFLTAWAYRHGPAAIEGFIHDAAGYAVLALTTLGLLVLVGIMGRKEDAANGH